MERSRANRRPVPADEARSPAAGERASGSADGSGTTRLGVRPARHLEVDEDDAGQRLDAFLSRSFIGIPKSHLYRWIRSGQLRVNGARRPIDYRLQPGDRIRIPPIFDDDARGDSSAAASHAVGHGVGEPVRRERTRLARRLPVLFEDDDLIALDKPASVAVHGGSGVSSGVIEQLRAARPQARVLELVHRLDRETSGVLLVAKKRAALVGLHRQLRERDTDKRYRAIVFGRWPLRTRTLAFPLQRRDAPDGDRRVVVERDGLDAVTHVTGLARFELPGFGDFSLVEARLETGRTHQIRVHLAHAGCPIAGDDKYGDFERNRCLRRAGHRRMYLHAHSIEFRHPSGGQRLRIEAPLPQAFGALIAAGVDLQRAGPAPAGSR
ncbi:MAG TPA: RluA family pseudouridine synthase [Zeimonas sp.]